MPDQLQDVTALLMREAELDKKRAQAQSHEDILIEVSRLKKMDEDLVAHEEVIKAKREIRNRLAQQGIPTMMDNTGLKFLGTNDGSKVEIGSLIAANIPCLL